MIPEPLHPWLLFVGTFALLGGAYRLVTNVLVAFFYRLTHHPTLAMLLYALFVWPGTVLHEFSHWAVARLLGVRASLPHLLPSGVDARGRMVLGHVTVERADFVRGALIGVAPFLVGSSAVALLARHAFALPIPVIEVLGAQGLGPLIFALPTLLGARDAWLMLYLLFAVANGMMPSPSDRRDWPAFLGFALLVGLFLVFVLGVRSVPEALSLWALRAAAWLTFAFVIAIVLDMALLLLVWPLERLLALVGR